MRAPALKTPGETGSGKPKSFFVFGSMVGVIVVLWLTPPVIPRNRFAEPSHDKPRSRAALRCASTKRTSSSTCCGARTVSELTKHFGPVADFCWAGR